MMPGEGQAVNVYGVQTGMGFLPDELRQKRWCYNAELVCINNYIKKVKKNAIPSQTTTFSAIVFVFSGREERDTNRSNSDAGGEQ